MLFWSHCEINMKKCLSLAPCHTVLSPISSRTARGDGLCPFYSRYRDLCSSDDVLNHPPNCLLHCLDLWRGHHAHAVVHEYTVSLCIHLYAFISMSVHVSSSLVNVFFCQNHHCYTFSFRVGVDSDQDNSVSNHSRLKRLKLQKNKNDEIEQ